MVLNGLNKEDQVQQFLLKALWKRLLSMFYNIVTLNLGKGYSKMQIIGIPMGLDPAPFFANLFLNYYESRWTRHLRKSYIRNIRRLVNVFCFFDDL